MESIDSILSSIVGDIDKAFELITIKSSPNSKMIESDKKEPITRLSQSEDRKLKELRV
jgi:hypothetical protein